ncbi:MAG: ADP-ribosylglycohydrolase family protein [Clostridia bacterium]|nr:ADP-ribosylglycohydrolase family protein [Clostridia bacterium]
MLAYKTYLEKLTGCFTGKAVGGTLGMPLEGHIGTTDVTYYNPVPTEMIANDDLDLQVVWLETIREKGLPVTRRDLADGWLAHTRVLCDEYGACMRNMRNGLYPPLSGAYDNLCTAGMGSVIRTEIWAALAPGDPDLAVQLALEDACVDHARDGVDATAFMAALESLAYTESDISMLIDSAMSYLPEQSRVRRMLTDALAWWEETKDARAVREKILGTYPWINWTDVAINASYIILGLLDGEQESDPMKKISRGICTAVGLGHDADCTGATLGSIFGILYPDSFDERWTKPLGDALVLSYTIVGMHEVKTIPELCMQIADVCCEVQKFYHSVVTFADAEEPKNALRIRAVSSDAHRLRRGKAVSDYNEREALISVTPFTINMIYPESVAHKPGETLTYTAEIFHPKGHSLTGCLSLHPSDGWTVTPEKFPLSGEKMTITFSVTAPVDKIRRTCKNSLTFSFVTAEDITIDIPCGLMTTIPAVHVEAAWDGETCPPDSLFEGGELQQWTEWSHPVGTCGGHLYAFEMRTPYLSFPAVFSIQAPGKFRLWRNGELLKTYDGPDYNPTFHRAQSAVKLPIANDWDRYVVYVEREEQADVSPENCEPFFRARYDGRLLFGLAEWKTLSWLDEAEFRIPQLGTK